MKKKLILTILFLTIPAMAFAGTYSVKVDWTYPTGITDLVGFNLYVDSGLVCSTADPLVRTMTCVDVVLPDGTGNYTLTAYDTIGTESAQSATVTYNPPLPSPTGLSVSGQ